MFKNPTPAKIIKKKHNKKYYEILTIDECVDLFTIRV